MRFSLVLAVLLLVVTFVSAYSVRRVSMKHIAMSDMPALTFRCYALTPGCMGQEAYDLYMAKHNILSEAMIRFPAEIRCRALIPECIGEKAYTHYKMLSDIRAPDFPIKNDRIRYLMADAPVPNSLKKGARFCKALTPSCMGREAYEKYIQSLVNQL